MSQELSQDLFGLTPLKRLRETPSTHSTSQDGEPENKLSRVNYSTQEDLQRFIQHNYLTAIATLFHSVKDLLSGEGNLLDDEKYEKIVAQYKQLQQAEKCIPQTGKKVVGYNIFCREEYIKMRSENPDLSFREIRPIVAAKWKNMSQAEKAPYVKKAEQVPLSWGDPIL